MEIKIYVVRRVDKRGPGKMQNRILSEGKDNTPNIDKTDKISELNFSVWANSEEDCLNFRRNGVIFVTLRRVLPTDRIFPMCLEIICRIEPGNEKIAIFFRRQITKKLYPDSIRGRPDT